MITNANAAIGPFASSAFSITTEPQPASCLLQPTSTRYFYGSGITLAPLSAQCRPMPIASNVHPSQIWLPAIIFNINGGKAARRAPRLAATPYILPPLCQFPQPPAPSIRHRSKSAPHTVRQVVPANMRNNRNQLRHTQTWSDAPCQPPTVSRPLSAFFHARANSVCRGTKTDADCRTGQTCQSSQTGQSDQSGQKNS